MARPDPVRNASAHTPASMRLPTTSLHVHGRDGVLLGALLNVQLRHALRTGQGSDASASASVFVD